jgi:hypothetical protein
MNQRLEGSKIDRVAVRGRKNQDVADQDASGRESAQTMHPLEPRPGRGVDDERAVTPQGRDSTRPAPG